MGDEGDGHDAEPGDPQPIDGHDVRFPSVRPKAIALFARHYPAEYLGDTIESLVIASRAGLRVAQVPVAMHPRQGGRASQRPLRAGLYLGRAVLALVVALSRRSRLKAQP